MKSVKLFIVASTLWLVTGCTTVVHDHGYHGPPPHTAHHGYRYYYDDMWLEFDSNLGIYIVIGYPNVYFYHDYYYYYWDGHWHHSKRPHGPWTHIPHSRVPPKLYHRYYKKPHSQDQHWQKVDPYRHDKYHYKNGLKKEHHDHDRKDSHPPPRRDSREPRRDDREDRDRR